MALFFISVLVLIIVLQQLVAKATFVFYFSFRSITKKNLVLVNINNTYNNK